MAKPIILIFGHDEQLLETRHYTLELAGTTVYTATRLPDACQIVNTQFVSIFILCHTLSSDEREKAIRIANSIRPEIRNLVLVSGRGLADDETEVPRVYAGSRTLHTTVMRILDQRDLACLAS